MTSEPARRENAVAFVVARLNSSRLEAKQFRTIGDRSLLDWIIERLRASRELSRIVLTTVAEPGNLPLRDYAAEHGIDCFWYEGDPNHVTHRLSSAAQAFQADICVLISGDCPLVDGPLVDLMIAALRETPRAQAVAVPPRADGAVAYTEGIGVFRRRAWVEGDELADRPELKENHFPTVWRHPERFPVLPLSLPDVYYGPHHRISVDTPADLDFMNRLYRLLVDRGLKFTLPNVLDLLWRQPELCEINRHVHQRRLGETHLQVVYAVDCGPDYGYGHLMRSRELGRRIVEQLSWPVTFVVDDPRGAELLLEQGGRVVWGAVGRERRPLPASLSRLQSVNWAGHDLLLLDLYPRPLPESWRAPLGTMPLVVLDCLLPWTDAADLILVPGIAAAESSGDSSRILSGLEYTLLRREVVEQPATEKTLDLLAYLPEANKRSMLRKLAEAYGWSLRVADGGSSHFVNDLARARVFLGNFGVSVYEALRLGTVPVVWPISERHAAEARRFYSRLGLPELLIDGVDELPEVMRRLQHQPLSLPRVPDGTPAVLSALRRRFLSSVETSENREVSPRS